MSGVHLFDINLIRCNKSKNGLNSCCVDNTHRMYTFYSKNVIWWLCIVCVIVYELYSNVRYVYWMWCNHFNWFHMIISRKLCERWKRRVCLSWHEKSKWCGGFYISPFYLTSLQFSTKLLILLVFFLLLQFIEFQWACLFHLHKQIKFLKIFLIQITLTLTHTRV